MPISWPVPRPNGALEIAKQVKNLSAFSSLFDFKKNKVSVDSLLFKLHSVITVFILLVGTLFISMRQYFGDPIECLTSRVDIPQATIQHYCWLEGTWSVAGASTGIPGIQVGYPGVRMLDPTKGERRVNHKYYQWVYFILVIQGIVFYVPKYMWKAKEDKRLRQLITDLKVAHISELRDYDRNRLLQDVVDTLLISNDYFMFFLFCELVCLVHVALEIWFTNMFLSGSFLKLGIEWLFYAHGESDVNLDPLIRVFPRMTKCTFHKFGLSGTIEPIDALCFLPLNIINEKLFVILWFWYLFLMLMGVLILIWQIIHLVVAPLRYKVIKALAPSTDKKYLRSLTRRPGNYFVLAFIAKNMKPSHFRDLIDYVMKEHFDQNGKPLYNGANSKGTLTKAVENAIKGVQSKDKSKGKSSKEKHKKSKLDQVVISPPPAAGFVYVTRDPPSGNSANDWQDDEWPQPVPTAPGAQPYPTSPPNEQWHE